MFLSVLLWLHVISVAIPDVLFRNTKTNYRLKTDSVNYGILSRQGGEKQYMLVPLQRLVAVVRQYVLHYSVRNSSLMLLFCYVCINFFAAVTHVYLIIQGIYGTGLPRMSWKTATNSQRHSAVRFLKRNSCVATYALALCIF